MRRSFPLLLLAAACTFAQKYDVVVVGGTSGGVTTAARAGRLGLKVLLVNYSRHIGGMVSGGIGVMDTLYDGSRAPLVDEFYAGVLGYYRLKYGADSPQLKLASPAPRTASTKRLTFEPHVAEAVLEDMLRKSGQVEVLRRYYPVSVERAERQIRSVRLRSFDSAPERQVEAGTFVDSSYEGDLMALAGAEYRVGREDREEYGEPHAGRIFSKRYIPQGSPASYPTEARTGDLHLRPFQAVTQEIFAGSTGEGDNKVQAYHYRLTLSSDEANRRPVTRPAGYDRAQVVSLIEPYRSALSEKGNVPNNKTSWFMNFSGQASGYAQASWPERRKIEDAHKQFALSVLWFLQNDESIPAAQREKNRRWGLPKDEFTENEGVPYEMYIREARRLSGRYVMTEMDATLARGYARAPVHEDSIAVTDWFMDSHEVSTERVPGSDQDGKIILSELTRPAQIPYRSLLPKGIDNLLVPVCVSSTHVAWGAIRLEPTWMHVGEAAAHAIFVARQAGKSVGEVDPGRVQQELVKNGVMVSFFNDVDMKSDERFIAALEYLGARGFFAGYDARPGEPLGRRTGELWTRFAAEVLARRGDAAARARELAAVGADNDPMNGRDFAERLRVSAAYWGAKVAVPSIAGGSINRGEAARVIFTMLADAR